jgi:hypothetical protein
MKLSLALVPPLLPRHEAPPDTKKGHSIQPENKISKSSRWRNKNWASDVLSMMESPLLATSMIGIHRNPVGRAAQIKRTFMHVSRGNFRTILAKIYSSTVCHFWQFKNSLRTLISIVDECELRRSSFVAAD